ncbi:WSC domain-containing protein [Lachnellula arida]|uniref:Peroxidase n=1 Tax=Lachnellula arida TaxID=1316785 RepID=A0A8T9B8W0_9HELO|nr:WSC domain-containing protein [Lachnellula arida]
MMLFFTLITLLLQFRGLNCQALDANGVSLDEKILAIERLLLTPGTIMFPVTPCSFTLDGPQQTIPAQNGSDQTAAQWVRTVFHDFITADASAGTGGLDASIGFEADRPENLGLVFNAGTPDETSFINATIIGFNLFSSIFISTSDFIALGLATSLLSCEPDARMIQLKVGRIDATVAGPTGVPRPEDSLEIATAAFAKAGLNQTEMIQAVACGHSVGAVHILDQPTVGDGGADHFDSTPFVFDAVGVNEYLNGSGQAGGPLVTTQNKTFRSDLRIFNSDSNATIKAMASSTQSFEDACFTVFEKMINTVPKTVTLSTDLVGPRPWILMESHLDLSSTGAVQYSGNITTKSRFNPSVPTTATYGYGTSGGEDPVSHTSDAGVVQSNLVNGVISDPFGDITQYSFNDTLTNTDITSITVQNSYTESINLNLFVVPSQSFMNPTNVQQPTYVVRVAVLSTLASGETGLQGTLYYAATQPNSVSPVYKQVNIPLTSYKTSGAYTIFHGVVTQPVTAGTSHIDVQLGSQRSAKALVSLFGGRFFGLCSNADMTTC